MTAEQLQNARAAAFHQDGRPLLTAEDAAVWLRETGLCLLQPRTREIAASAPSLVEATLGRFEPEPAPDALATANGLLRRLVASGDAVPLQLLGAAGPGASDQPDLLCTEETLPFVYALRGDREWTRGPRGKSSPLEGEVWKLLGRDGALSAAEIRDRIGRHLTESAALRALGELWADLRVEPLYADDGDTRWQRLETRHEASMTAGSAMGQGMALSALVSLYLQSAIAATGEEIEAFLSPLASRSRVREAVRGLHATRQLGVRNLGPREHFYVEGSLPAFADGVAAAPPGMLPEVQEPTDRVVVGDVVGKVVSEVGSELVAEVAGEGGGFRIEALSEAETERERSVGEGRKRFVAGRSASGGDRKPYGARPPAGGKPSQGEGRKPFFAREPWKEDRRPSAPRAGEGARPENTGGDRRSFAPREGGGGFAGGAKRPFAPREGGRPPFGSGDRKPFAPREGGRPPFGSGDRKPFAPREGDDRRPFGGGSASGSRNPASGSPRGEAPARPFQKPFQKSFDKPFRKPFAEGEAREKRPFSPRTAPGAGPRTAPRSGPPSEGGARPPRRPFSPGGGSYTPRDEGSGRKPFPPRPGGDREDPRPARGGFAPRGAGSFRPREDGGRPYEDRGQGGRKPPFRARPFAPRDREGSAPERGSDRGAERGTDSGTDRGGTPGRRPFAQPFRPASGGEGKRPFTPRTGGAGKPFRRAGEGFGGDSPRRTGRTDAGAGPGRFDGEGGRPPRPGAPAGGARPGGKRPRTAPFTSTGKPRPGAGATGRPGPRSARPGAGPRKPGSKGGPKRP